MITKEEFVKYISLYQEFDKAVKRLEKSITGKNNIYFIFETDWCIAVGKMLDIFLNSHFTDTGKDWIFYYLFETIEDKKVTITKEADLFKEKEEVEYHLNSIDELWDFLLTDKKLYFKNAE